MTYLDLRLLKCFVLFATISMWRATGFRAASNSQLFRSSPIQHNLQSRLTRYDGKSLIFHHPIGSNINEATERDDALKSAKSTSFNTKALVSIITIVVAAAAIGGSRSIDFDFPALLEKVVVKIGSLGPYGYLYFAAVRVPNAQQYNLSSSI